MLSFTFKKCAILWLFFCLFFSTLNAGANPLENNDNNQIADPISAPNNIASADLEAEKQSTTEGLNDAEIVSKVNNPSEKIIKDKKAFDKSLNILASGSLTNVMQDIIKEYSVIKNISVNVVFDSPSELILDVEAGDLADVFISEYPKKMVELQQKGLIDGFNIVNLYSDNLVIVTAKNHPILNKIAGVKDPETILRIISTSDLLVLPDPDFDPAGAFAREALEKYNLWDLFRNKTYRVSSTRNALYLISKGQRTGIVYKSDALSDKDVVILGEIPPEMHGKILYQAAVIAGDNMESAREFLDYLKSKDVKKMFAKGGIGE